MQADFYLLESTKQCKWETACRLLEKAYERNHQVFVYCDSEADAHKIDELLWTFKEDSFVPHNLQGEGPNPPPPIQIGFQEQTPPSHDVLLNLSTSIPSFVTQFRRVLEIISTNDTDKDIGREHYRYYRGLQFTLKTHPIQAKA